MKTFSQLSKLNEFDHVVDSGIARYDGHMLFDVTTKVGSVNAE